jgi:DNA-binding transcriptional MerR regulator
LKEKRVAEFLTTKAVSLRTGLTPDCIRWHERQGHLLVIKAERSPGSYQRLYLAEDVERFVALRKARKLARAPREADEAEIVAEVV